MNRIFIRSSMILGISTLFFVACGSGTSQESAATAPASPAASENSTPSDSAPAAIETQPAPASTLEAIGMSLTWRVEAERLQITLSGPTEGWIAVGFRPSRAMKDANIHIGYVDGSDVVMTDQFGTGLITHKPDVELGGNSDIADLSGDESGGTTTIRYSIPLDSGDEYDQPLVPGETIPVILAWGRADNTTGAHRDRTTIQITL